MSKLYNILNSIITSVKKVETKVETQPDLAQNDSTQPDYIKNRTHYVELSSIIEEQTIEGFSVMQDPIYAVQNPFVFTPTVGQKYIVHWDGDEYSVDAKEFDEFDGLIYIGNENYVNMISGGDIPFAIIFAESNVFVSTESTAASHTICIEGEVVHKLDKKYLPDDDDDVVYFFAESSDDFPHVYLDFNMQFQSSRENVIDAIDRGAKVILINVDDASEHHPLIYADTEIGCLVFEYFGVNSGGYGNYIIKYTCEYVAEPR